MTEEKMLTVRDVAMFLKISEKEVVSLAHEGRLPSHKVDGNYVRFRKDEVLAFDKSSSHTLIKKEPPLQDSPSEKLNDFLYLNDFYIISVLVIIALMIAIFRGY